MKSEEWKTYRTRFLVKAKRLSSALSFTDHLGRQHCGRKGDYLVESCDGVISIAPRQIFEDIYVPMFSADALPEHEPIEPHLDNPLPFGVEPLKLEIVSKNKFQSPVQFPRRTDPDFPRARRKSAQPARSIRTAAHLGLM